MSATSKLVDAVPALLPGAVAFVVFPVLYYTGNYRSLIDVGAAPIGFALAFLVWAALVGGATTLSRNFSEYVAGMLFWFGVYLLVADAVAPLRIGPLAKGDELTRIPEPLRDSVHQFLVAMVLIAIAVSAGWGRSMRTLCSVFVVTVLVVNGVSLGAVFLREASTFPVIERTAGEVIDTGNVYHIVFDAFGGNFLELAKELEVAEEFDGFTLFSENLANSDFSSLSVRSFMTGTLPKLLGYSRWSKKWQSGESVLGIAQSNGYRVWEYESFVFNYGNADVLVGPDQVDLGAAEISEALAYYDHVLLRLVPVFLRQDLFVDGRGLITRIASAKTQQEAPVFVDKLAAAGPRSIVLLNRIIEDERSRPPHGQYVFAHLMLPHLPYRYNRHLERSETGTSYREQSMASVKLMTMLLAGLKASGAYESSTIVLQGDHGQAGPSERVPSGLRKDPRALLLIKRPGDVGNLRISDYRSQLLDIAPTLYDVLGFDVDLELAGTDLFSPNKDPSRDIHVLSRRHVRGGRNPHVIHRAGAGWIDAWGEER